MTTDEAKKRLARIARLRGTDSPEWQGVCEKLENGELEELSDGSLCISPRDESPPWFFAVDPPTALDLEVLTGQIPMDLD